MKNILLHQDFIIKARGLLEDIVMCNKVWGRGGVKCLKILITTSTISPPDRLTTASNAKVYLLKMNHLVVKVFSVFWEIMKEILIQI